jgi:hypothetical protein
MALEKAMPVPKKRNALEEAEWEEEGGDNGALEREMLLQCRFCSMVRHVIIQSRR